MLAEGNVSLFAKKSTFPSKARKHYEKKIQNIEILLENKLDLGIFMNIYFLILGEIFGAAKCG